MKVQLQGQRIRLRIQEAELEHLFDGGEVENRTRYPDGRVKVQRVSLSSRLAWQRTHDGWFITLPAAEVRAYSKRLPTREGLRFTFDADDGTELELLFDVDVRDSARTRLSGHSTKENP